MARPAPSSPAPAAPDERRAPLDGIRVLDLSRVLAGPWCTMTLGDLGADVIKVEHPNGGDETRGWGPTFIGGESAYFLCANRNKRSIAIDLASAAGQATVRELAATCDVVVENFKAGTLARYGLDHESLRAVRADLIYCSISGYGRASPLADRAGYDFVIQAEGGLMSVTGVPEGEPMKVGVAVADLYTGMVAVQAILAALHARRHDGRGQLIDLALFDCQLAMLANVASAALASGEEPLRYGNAHASVVPYQLLPTADTDIVVAIGNDEQYRRLCVQVLEREDLAADPRFRTNRDRLTDREPLIAAITEALRARTAAQWLERLNRAGIPAGAVRGVGAALASPEATARGMVRTVQHPVAGELRLVESPLRLNGTPPRIRRAPPLLGQHTEQILAELRRPPHAGPARSGGVNPPARAEGVADARGTRVVE